MPFLHALERKLHCNIAYFGPGLSGKTTTLKHIYSATAPEARSRWAVAVEPFPVVGFYLDLPGLPEVDGARPCLHLSTVPGHVWEDDGRQALLRNVDAVVFVADSQISREYANEEFLENLRIHLADQGRDPDSVPLVLQYNKRDLPEVATVEEMDQLLNPNGLPRFEAVAVTGAGVFDVLKAVVKLLLLGLKAGRVEPHPLTLLKAPDDPLRLWSIFRSDLPG